MLKLQILYTIYYFSLGSSIIYFSGYFNSIGIEGKTIGMIFSIGSLLAMVTQPLLGFIADKSRKPLLVLTLLLIIMAFSMSILYLTLNIKIIYLTYVLYSIAIWGIMPLLDGIVLSSGHDFGKVRMFGSVGFAIGCFFTGIIMEKYGKSSFIILTVITSILSLVSAKSLDKVNEKEHDRASLKDIGEIFSNSPYLIFLIFAMVISGAVTTFNAFCSIYFFKIGSSAKLLGITVMIFTLCEIPFMYCTKMVVEKFGLKNSLVFSGWMFALRWGIYYLLPYPGAVVGTFFIHGLSSGLYFSLSSMYISNIVSKKVLSTAITTFMAAGTLGGTVLQYISGRIIDSYGVITIFLLLSTISVLSTILLKKFEKKENLKKQRILN
ncbi:MAG: MFS transporter [Fusobacteriaceae bacterium]|nr:MFS transporter [Fusobacteriaceae bacterium]